MANSPLVVFDLDGTLVDTAPDLIAALNVILAKEGIPELPLASARNLIGGGARKLIERGLEAGGRDLHRRRNRPDDGGFHRLLRRPYRRPLAPVRRARAALDDLAAKGTAFAVCTNKLEWLSKLLMDRLKLSPRFKAICGADTFGIAKPDPSFLRQTVARAGGHMASTIMVGDAGTDVGVARRANVPVIGVTFGYTETPIEQLKPDRVISRMEGSAAGCL